MNGDILRRLGDQGNQQPARAAECLHRTGRTGDEGSADTGRGLVWAALAEARSMLFGITAGKSSLVAIDGYPMDDDDEDDDAAKEMIADVLDALSARPSSRPPSSEDGDLYGDGLLIATANTPLDLKDADVFKRVMSTTTVEFGSTKYTRFGAWNRVESDNAMRCALRRPPIQSRRRVRVQPAGSHGVRHERSELPGRRQRHLRGSDDRPGPPHTARYTRNLNTYYEGSIDRRHRGGD